jgi:hypothetical protein
MTTQDYESANSLYRIRFKPYVSGDVVIHPNLNINRLYYDEITADVNQF